MEPKNLLRSKTFWLAISIIAGGIAELMSNLPAEASVPTILAGIVAIIIRYFTNTPISGSPSSKPPSSEPQ